MMDRLVAIRDKLLAFWNRYTTKQKTIIICVALAILFAIVLLAYFLTRPVYVDLVTLNADAASEFREQLDAAGVDYEDEAISTDRVRFRVEQGQYSDAVVVMGANQITDSEKTIALSLPFIKKPASIQAFYDAPASDSKWNISTLQSLPPSVACQPRGGFLYVIK